jgi:DNA-binding Lrp family transcriptional regulator
MTNDAKENSALTFLDKVTPYVRSEGARNFYRISKELDVPYETLRFRMLNLRDQGITVFPVVDVERLGLRRKRVSFRLSQDFVDLKPFFAGLHQKAGLTYYSCSLFNRIFDCEFTIPEDKEAEFNRFLRSLDEMKLISDHSTREIIWKEILMMNTKFYDYQEKEWTVDFSRLSGDPSFSASEKVLPKDAGGDNKNGSNKKKVDLLDLLIIKELQMNAWVKTIEISRQLKVSDRDVAYHLDKHVFGKSLVPNFRFRWVGTKDAWLKHAITPIEIEFQGLNENAIRHAISVLTSIPFTWNVMRTEDQLLCQLMIPTSHMPETLRYVSENLTKLGIMSPVIRFVDWQRTSSYTVPYLMFEKGVGWKFNAEESLAYLLQMIQTYSK